MIALGLLVLGSKITWAQKPVPAPQKVILDTDIGDDIDDAYALALVLTSPELKLLGVTTAWGNTGLRAQLVEGLLCEAGQRNIPVFVGVPTKANNVFTQASWASRFPSTSRGRYRCDRMDGEDDSRQSRPDHPD